MATFKIGLASEVTNYADADLWSFPRNPNDVDIKMLRKKQDFDILKLPINFVREYGWGIKSIVMLGWFNGATRRNDYDDLAHQVFTGGERRLYLESDRFMFVFGSDLKQVKRGERDSNAIDYQAQFIAPDPFVYSDTSTSPSGFTISTANETSISTGLTNLGDAFTQPSWIIQNIGTANITKVEIGDTTTLAACDNKTYFKVTWEGTLAQNSILTITSRVVSDYGAYRFVVRDIDGGGYSKTGIYGKMPRIRAKQTNQTMRVKLTGNNGSSTVTTGFRERWF